MSVTVRLFEPISLLLTENAMPSLRATVPPPHCILCDTPAAPPSRMGWLQAPDRQAVFCVCGGCSDCSDAELETKIIAHVSGPADAGGSQGAYWPDTSGGGGYGPAHLGSSGGGGLGKASDGSATAGGVTAGAPAHLNTIEPIDAASLL